MADADTLTTPDPTGKRLREERAYANLLGDADGVRRLTREIEEHDARQAEAAAPLTDEQSKQVDALGGHLANARRELIQAQKLADALGAGSVHMKGAMAISTIDDATAEVQELAR